MQNPTIYGKYTVDDTREYALYRKNTGIETIKNLFNDEGIKEGDMSPEEHQEYKEPLAFSKELVVDIQLSTGGDADGYKLSFNEANELMDGVYYWADWGVYEEVRLDKCELELVDRLYSVSEWLNA